MDLAAPLQSLIPTLDGAALTVLAGTESALGQSQIHRLAPRGTRSGLALALDRLVEHGIVVAEPTNYGYLYRLNRDHVLAPAVLAVAAAREEFLHRLADACRGLTPAVHSAALFGSVARRESGVASDVDLLLVVPDVLDTGDEAWQEQVRGLEERVLAWSGNRLELITVTRDHLADLVESGEPIVRSWQDDALTLTGTDPRDLLVGSSRRRRAKQADDSSKEAR
ncbi:DNA polymerase beta domain protein region [Xylanimonas cellulosilytica DSM 15894]|uniref:DNA polymerase beta domain protein region n=1 Tax=Xylanimonas cellulosilytica (strain DSM 15894 / JCM 12276 / CECT 5975 / KCTC 9989 / LMG 20990 / NBRC 107835 / XIL07) TaxID=446471 RepID=D1BYM6_XYLCX|nr:nucleotidyltransferase domain-containing protein [Xylanimonas cellulosilytica]ACZ31898.1 DNA polymerase beta domain protein region [Xylanimonas cellulosilytica DSM 15894]